MKIINLTLRNFEHAAIVSTNGKRWEIAYNDIGPNGHPGISQHGSYAWVHHNYIHHSWTAGTGEGVAVGGYKDVGAVVEFNELAFNHWSVTKWLGTRSLTIRNNYIHDNVGNGIWLDYANGGAMVENNLVRNGTQKYAKALWSEVNCEAVGSGTVANVWRYNTVDTYYGEAAYMNGSSHDVVHNNLFAAGGDGPSDGARIKIFIDPRCPSGLSTRVHHNKVIIPDAQRAVKAVSGASFDRNDYDVPNPSTDRRWYWAGADRTFLEWQAYGNDVNGSAY